MKKTIKHPDGTEIIIEGTAEELAAFERTPTPVIGPVIGPVIVFPNPNPWPIPQPLPIVPWDRFIITCDGT